MKTENPIGVALVVLLVAGLAYWLGYQHGSSSPRVTVTTATNLKQVSLAFREGHNDVSRLVATGGAAVTNTQTQQR